MSSFASITNFGYCYMLMSLLVVTEFPAGVSACFPMQDVFKESCLWIQTTSMQSRLYISICDEGGTTMSIKPEGVDPPLENELKVDCLQSFGNHRYLVKVRDGQKTPLYQCYKFTSLTPSIVRQAKSKLVKDKDELRCSEVWYEADESVLTVRWLEEAKGKDCPLSGGFQMLMSIGGSTRQTTQCQDSIHNYRPQLQFECDGESSHVVADLGKHCTPQEVIDSQRMRGRYIAHLRCEGSWYENEGTYAEFRSVLLSMRDSPGTFWCLHFKQFVRNDSSVQEIMYDAFLTFDARCLQTMNGIHDSPKSTSMFGSLASFRPQEDSKCMDRKYFETCIDNGDQQCRESLACPHSCGRCKEKLKLERCSFPDTMRGNWEPFSEFESYGNLTISQSSLSGTGFGEFKCRYPGERNDRYALVQTGVSSTCMPYYTCAQITLLAPGLISFQMRPALRDNVSGRVYSCDITDAEVGNIRPEHAEEAVTLLETSKLEETQCHLSKPLVFPSAAIRRGCHYSLNKCSGACKTFTLSLESETCDNMTAKNYGLIVEHTCMAKFSLANKMVAILTRSIGQDGYEYHCWLFYSNRAIVLRPDQCNQAAVDDVMEFSDRPEETFDPIYVLVESKSKSVDGNAAAHCLGLRCSDEVYIPVSSVWTVRWLDQGKGEPCPLSGGFQMITWRIGGATVETIRRCQDSIFHYGPSFQFQCDNSQSSHVASDLGQLCTPQEVVNSQRMRGRYIAHLRCVGSWYENKGTRNEALSVLMSMRDSPGTFWCLQVLEYMRNDSSDQEIMYDAFLSFDGRCFSDMSPIPGYTSISGKLASFRPQGDSKCEDRKYFETCRDDGDEACRMSLVCPHSCGRCKDKLKLEHCSFSDTMKGHWEPFSEFQSYGNLTVTGTTVIGSDFGEFKCRYPGERNDRYALVQTGVSSTCMPYYTCAQITVLAPGLISFQMRPALRDDVSGIVYSCEITHAQVGNIRPEHAEKAVTLLQTSKLEETQCHLSKPLVFPSAAIRRGCHYALSKCSGACKTFNLSLEYETCDNMTAKNYGLIVEHTCMAKFLLANKMVAILTRSTGQDGYEYHCWLFYSNRAIVLRPDQCNQAAVDDVMEFSDRPEETFDPIYVLVESKSNSVDGNAAAHCLGVHYQFILLVLLCHFLIFIFAKIC